MSFLSEDPIDTRGRRRGYSVILPFARISRGLSGRCPFWLMCKKANKSLEAGAYRQPRHVECYSTSSLRPEWAILLLAASRTRSRWSLRPGCRGCCHASQPRHQQNSPCNTRYCRWTRRARRHEKDDSQNRHCTTESAYKIEGLRSRYSCARGRDRDKSRRRGVRQIRPPSSGQKCSHQCDVAQHRHRRRRRLRPNQSSTPNPDSRSAFPAVDSSRATLSPSYRYCVVTPPDVRSKREAS